MLSITNRIDQLRRRDVRLYDAARQRIWGRGRGNGKPLSPEDRARIIARRDQLGNRIWLESWAIGHADVVADAWARLAEHGPLPAGFGSSVPQDYPEDWRSIIANAYAAR